MQFLPPIRGPQEVSHVKNSAKYLFAVDAFYGPELQAYREALLVLPAGYFLWGLLSMIVAYVFVPGSPFVARWHLAGEILRSANSFLWVPLIGLFIGVMYLTHYRWMAARLPAALRTDQSVLTWNGLRIPALLAAVSVVAGMIAIL